MHGTVYDRTHCHLKAYIYCLISIAILFEPTTEILPGTLLISNYLYQPQRKLKRRYLKSKENEYYISVQEGDVWLM